MLQQGAPYIGLMAAGQKESPELMNTMAASFCSWKCGVNSQARCAGACRAALVSCLQELELAALLAA